jgi:hypothetical protein
VLAPATLAALPSIRAIETRLFPSSLAATHRGFALITRTSGARASYLAALPSTRAIPDRDVFYVAFPKRSIPSLATCSMSLIPIFGHAKRNCASEAYEPPLTFGMMVSSKAATSSNST